MKTELILLMYDALIGGGSISRKIFCAQYKISERTFYRYLRELTAYLAKHRSACTVEVLEPDGRYFLKKGK